MFFLVSKNIFGVSTKKHVQHVCKSADGVIVGSAILKVLKNTGDVSKTVRFAANLSKGLVS